MKNLGKGGKMNTENLYENPITFANRDRICPYCYTDFFANDLKKYFCCDKCADTYYNEVIRPQKKAEKLNAQKKAEEQKMEAYKNALPVPENILKRTIEIFDKLTIDPIVGTMYHLKDILGLGANLKVFSYKEQISGKVEDCYALIFGKYRITILDNETIKIETLKNK